MTVTVYVPGDSAATSVGADRVAEAIGAQAVARGLDITIVRNGSRGLLWIEPLVEVVTDRGRIGYGPVNPEDVVSLVAADFLNGGDHELCQGVVDAIPWLANQQRVTFQRVGIIDPLDLGDYGAHGGLVGLRAALARDQSFVVEEVLASGLRGRGGAGFPAGIKWRTVLEADADQKYVCCNADEGDSGAVADTVPLVGASDALAQSGVEATFTRPASNGRQSATKHLRDLLNAEPGIVGLVVAGQEPPALDEAGIDQFTSGSQQRLRSGRASPGRGNEQAIRQCLIDEGLHGPAYLHDLVVDRLVGDVVQGVHVGSGSMPGVAAQGRRVQPWHPFEVGDRG